MNKRLLYELWVQDDPHKRQELFKGTATLAEN